jgi:hypothetical protein
LAEGNNIGENDLAQGDDTATANALDGPADEEDSEGFGNGCAKKCTQGKQNDGHEKHLFPPKDVGQGSDERLADG